MRVVLQSCLCPTPEIRSFHMGIVLPAFNALPRHLSRLMMWMQSGREPLTGRVPFWSDEPAAANDSVHPDMDPHGDASDALNLRQFVRRSTLSQGQRTPVPSPTPVHKPPLRGNWPFTVRPVACPVQPASRPVNSARGILAAQPAPHRRAPVTSLVATESPVRRVPCAVRRFADPGSGRLAISGRMADVCAELDRLAAFEALQPCRSVGT